MSQAAAVEWGVYCPKATDKDKKSHTQRVICEKPMALECAHCRSVEVPLHKYVASSRREFLTDYRAWRPRPVKGIYW